MRLLISFALVLFVFAGPLTAQRCRCVPRGDDDTTRPGANEHIIIAEKQAYKRIAGVVTSGDGNTVPYVFVEVFDNPDHLLLPYPENTKKQKPQRRIAACMVGDDGQFCFSNIPAGKYEVRFSKDGGWKHTSVVLTVGGRKATNRALEITMQVGT